MNWSSACELPVLTLNDAAKVKGAASSPDLPAEPAESFPETWAGPHAYKASPTCSIRIRLRRDHDKSHGFMFYPKRGKRK